MKNKKIYHIVPKIQRKIVEIQAQSIPLTPIHERSLSRFKVYALNEVQYDALCYVKILCVQIPYQFHCDLKSQIIHKAKLHIECIS